LPLVFFRRLGRSKSIMSNPKYGKKKLRKMERAELRAQGLLGRKAGNPDLKVKYPKEMN
jgi:hypothetical protein